MKRLSLLTLLFAMLFLLFFLLLVFLKIPFPPKPLMSWQDAIDVLTPMVLVPLYWLIFRHSTIGATTLVEEAAFLVLVVAWVTGHGMHLSANSISNLAERLRDHGGLDVTSTDVFALTHFYDEVLSHYLRDIGVLGLAALLVRHEWRQPVGEDTVWWATVPAGFVHGFTLYCVFVESQTVVLGLPFTAALCLIGLIWGGNRLWRRPVLAFFCLSCLVALILLVGWGLYWGGFPQFTEVGLI